MKGIIIIKNQIKDYCASYDPFGTCSWEECFKCPNCDYKITLEDKTVIRDFKYKNTKGKNIKVDKFIIEIFDNAINLDIDNFLSNPKSDYKLTSFDGIVQRNDLIVKAKEQEQHREIIETMDRTAKEIFRRKEEYLDDVKKQEYKPQMYVLCDYIYVETENPDEAYIIRQDRNKIDENIDVKGLFNSYLALRKLNKRSPKLYINEINFEFSHNKKRINVYINSKKLNPNCVKNFIKTLLKK